MKSSRFRLFAPCSQTRAIGMCFAVVGFAAAPAFAALDSTAGAASINTYNGNTSATGLSTAGNWDKGAPFLSSGAGIGGHLLFTGTSGSTFTGGGGTNSMNAASFNVTNGSSYTLQVNATASHEYRLGYTTDGVTGTESIAAFTNPVSNVAQDLIYLSNGSALTFNAANDSAVGTDATMSLRQTGNFNIGAGSVLTVNTVIKHRASGIALSITGNGTTVFNAANTYSGLTTINGGTLKLGNAAALGTTAAGTTVSSGGVLDLNGQTVVGEAIGLSGTGISSGGALVNSGGAASLSGTVTLNGSSSIGGAGNISLGDVGQSGGTRSLTKVGTGTLTLGGTNSYTGGTTISEGILEITSGNSAGGSFVLSLGTGLTASPVLKLSSANALSTSATLVGSNSFTTTGTVDLAVAGAHTLGAYNGNNLKFTASSGNATTLNFTGNSALTSGNSTSRTLTNNDANLTIVFAGSLDIGSSANGTPVITGSGNTTVDGDILSTGAGVRALAKSGSGTLTLNGSGFYAGGTAVSAGKLVINGNISTSSLTTVSGTGTISGIGTTGDLTIASGGTLSPGNSPGTLATGDEIWQNGGSYNWQILDATGAAGTGFDTVAVTGTLDLSSLTAGGFDINLWSLSLIAPDVNGDALNFNNALTQSWTILTTTGGIIGFNAADFTIASGINNNTGGFSNTFSGAFTLGQSGDSKNLILTYTVPEPTVAVLGAIGLLGLLRRRRNG